MKIFLIAVLLQCWDGQTYNTVAWPDHCLPDMVVMEQDSLEDCRKYKTRLLNASHSPGPAVCQCIEDINDIDIAKWQPCACHFRDPNNLQGVWCAEEDDGR